VMTRHFLAHLFFWDIWCRALCSSGHQGR
jgi:hypothetical protein